MAAAGVWAPITMRVLRHTFNKASNLVKARLADATRPLNSEIQPILVRNSPRQPIHPIARLRQAQKGRWYTTHSSINAAVRRFMSTAPAQAVKYNRAAFPSSDLTPSGINPTVTALSPLGATFPFGSTLKQTAPTLNTEGFLDVLSVDFSRALKDLAATLNDLNRLSSLGDLPITLEAKSVLRVRFPGCDAEIVERLCDEVGVERGIIYEDEDFDRTAGCQMALMFPYAPTSELTLSSPGGSLRSQTGHDFEDVEDIVQNPLLEGYESMEEASESGSAYFTKLSEHQHSSDYEGLEGIYRFLEQCDNSRRI